MKIIKRVELTDKEYEIVCIKCTSTLGVTIADLKSYKDVDRDGDPYDCVGITCPVCGKRQQTNVVPLNDVLEYERWRVSQTAANTK